MDTINIIEYLALIATGTYAFGVGAVWIYELRKNALYRNMKEQVRVVESFRLSMAVLHAKKYKIDEDYRRNISKLERVQQFILKNVLLIGSVHRFSTSLSLKVSR